MKLPGDSFFQEGEFSGSGGLGADNQPGFSFLRPGVLPNHHQDRFVVHHVEAPVLGREGFARSDPNIGPVQGKLTESQGAASQMIRPFHEEFKFHSFYLRQQAVALW
jgi:hypothetical protein